MIGRFIRYLYKLGSYQKPPNELKADWDWNVYPTTQEQNLLMRYGLARTPHDAQILLDKTGKRAWEIIQSIPRHKRRNVLSQWITFIRRLDGHDSRNPYKDKSKTDKIDYTYRFKD